MQTTACQGVFSRLPRWGLNQEGGAAEEHLQEVEMEYICNRECHTQFKSVSEPLIVGAVFAIGAGETPATGNTGLLEPMRESVTSCCVQVERVLIDRSQVSV